MNSEVLELEAKTAAAVRENARRLGISVDEYMKMLLPPETELALGGDSPDDAFERDMLEFGENVGQSNAYTGNYERSDIYFDHD